MLWLLSIHVVLQGRNGIDYKYMVLFIKMYVDTMLRVSEDMRNLSVTSYK